MESQDLVAFRMALRDLDMVVPADDRRGERRFTPTGALSRATVRLEPGSEALEADIVDLSPSGMRLAVRAGVQCAEGDHCRITLALSPAQRLQLEGEIRWSQQHPHITVFGVLLDPANAPLGPV